MPTRAAIISLFLLLAGDAVAQAPPAVIQTAVSVDSYAFSETDRVQRLDRRFAPPRGFTRVDVEAGSFAAWLRGLPVLRDRSTVHSYAGRRLSSPSAAIVDLDVGDKNLQQCADSAIRLHAEWLWSQGRRDELAYHFTSGDEVTYTDWVDGERIHARGSKVTRRRGSKRPDSHASMREWLDLVFRYAGTQSLRRDSVAVKPADIRPGDFFVAPGAPGHAVVVLDVAEHSDGRRVALLGQGFMPAQEFHVLNSRGSHVVDGVWFALPEDNDDELRTPSWRPFDAADARRFLPK